MQTYRYFLNRNKNGNGFSELLNGKIFVDKTGLIEEINEKISTKEKWVCVSKPRRFGKTMALEMLAAYYTKGIHTEQLFCLWTQQREKLLSSTLMHTMSSSSISMIILTKNAAYKKVFLCFPPDYLKIYRIPSRISWMNPVIYLYPWIWSVN